MANYRYETHTMPNPLLPFIYHRRFEVTQLTKYPNWHENIELLQCTQGSGYVHCDAESFPLCQGELFVINADTLHGIGTDSRMVYRCLIIDNSFFTANGVPIGTLYFQNTIRDAGMSGLFDSIAQAYEDYTPEDFRTVLAIRTQVLQLVQALCRGFTTQRPDSPSNEHIKKAMTYLRQNLSAPISLEELANFVGISKFHLSRQFKLFTGKTVVQTLNLMRCTEARRLIENGMGISAAAASCGFENTSYFTRTYKKLFGRLPSHSLPHTAPPTK